MGHARSKVVVGVAVVVDADDAADDDATAEHGKTAAPFFLSPRLDATLESVMALLAASGAERRHAVDPGIAIAWREAEGGACASMLS